MESIDASAQLSEADRLRSATRAEANRTPRGTAALMPLGVVAYFTVYGLLPADWRWLLSVAWTAFVVGWVVLLRRGRRAEPARRPRTRRDIVEWIALGVAANAIVIAVGRVSWALVGVLLAGMFAAYGGSVALRSRHS